MSKVETVLHEFKHGALHSGSKRGPKVTDRSQAIAIALSEARKAGEKVPKRQMGGSMTPPWYVRSEAHNLTHTGPILSAVPGRTDRHNMNVPSGSYVMPAAAVSHLGQSNTLAGMKILGRMFTSSPYGGGPTMGIPHGHLPSAPHIKMPGMTDQGGARGAGDGAPTPVVVAGGEFIIHPDDVRKVGGGDVKRGHRILDQWVKHIQKDHAKTIKNLAPPVKS